VQIDAIHHGRNGQSRALVYRHFLYVFNLFAATAATREHACVSPELPLCNVGKLPRRSKAPTLKTLKRNPCKEPVARSTLQQDARLVMEG